MDAGRQFFFAFFSLLRFSLNLGVVERPLVQGLIWGLATGDLTLAVSVSLVYELLWLDLIPAGTFIPPNPAASNFTALCLMTGFGLTGASQAVFPILLGMPVAWLAAGVERLHRNRQNRAYNTMQQWLAPGHGADFAPERLVWRSFAEAGAFYFVFFLAVAGVLAALCGFLLASGFLRPGPGVFSWGQLWIVASIGGLMSLRTPRAYVALVLCAVAVAALALFG